MKNNISESSVQANLFWRAAKIVSLDYGLYAKYSMLSMHSISQNGSETSNSDITIHKRSAKNYRSYLYSIISPRKSVTIKLGSQFEYYRSDKAFFTISPTFNTQISSTKQSIILDVSRRVKFSHLFQDTYDYLHSVGNANSAYKDPFLTSEVIKLNVKGGVGIFTFYTYDKRGIPL